MTLSLLRRLHKWVAVVVGLQILLWCVSGATFAWLEDEKVSGEHLAGPPARVAVPAALALADPRPLVARDTTEVRLLRVGERWVYRVTTEAARRLHDAATGAPVELDAPAVSALATALYHGEGRLVGVERHDAATMETRKHGAAWAATFDDELGTTLWLSADDGRLLETRTDTWRLFDIFWMLHTMDYDGRDDFNHPLVILFASVSLWVAVTGAWLVVRVFRKPKPAAPPQAPTSA